MLETAVWSASMKLKKDVCEFKGSLSDTARLYFLI